MLLKFKSTDILNTELIDVSSGRPKYVILTRASYILGKDNVITDVASRLTTIVDERGCVVVEIEWTGHEKKSGGLIGIMDNDPIKLAELFGGCETIDMSSGGLSIPTRMGYNWVATRESLIVWDSDAGKAVLKYYERCVKTGHTLSPCPISKIGTDYLEIGELPDAVIAELLAGYIFMNIMRRTRFDLPRYHFPLIDGPDGERQSFSGVLITHMKESLGGFRRNTL